jgi:hypothetical protein
MTRAAMVLCFVSVLVFAVATTSVPAGQSEGDKDSDRASTSAKESEQKLSPLVHATGGKQGASSKVYTNDDLKQLQGTGSSGSSAEPAKPQPASETKPGEPAAAAKPGEPAKSALDQMFEQEALRKEHVQKIAEAEQRVVDARQRVVDLEKRRLAIRNPLLARPAAPEEGADEWAGANGQQRVEMTDSQIQAAKDEVAQAELDLATLRSSRP